MVHDYSFTIFVSIYLLTLYSYIRPPEVILTSAEVELGFLHPVVCMVEHAGLSLVAHGAAKAGYSSVKHIGEPAGVEAGDQAE